MSLIDSIYSFRDEYILHGNLTQYSPVKRVFVRALRLIYAIVNDVMKGQLSLRAMSLVYTTFISMVPLLALSFSVLKGFGVHNQVQPFLENLLEPLGDQGAQVTNNIIDFVDNIEVGVLGAIGLCLLVYTVIGLMQKIEDSFNYIWRIDRDRSFSQKFSDYLSALLIGPLFIFLSAGLTTTIRNFEIIEQLGLTSTVDAALNILGVFLPFIIMTLAFTAIFIFMPNTRVKFVPAFLGGAFTAFMWKTMGFIFSTLIATSASYVAIYAAFATLILFMIWVYLAWFVILIGSSIAFYLQHPRYIHIGRQGTTLSIRLQEALALSVMYLIGKDFYNDKNDWDAVALSNELNMPVSTVNQIIDILIAEGLIAKTSDNASTYIPAKPLDKISSKTILDALRKHHECGALTLDRVNIPKEVKAILVDLHAGEKQSIDRKKFREHFTKAETLPKKKTVKKKKKVVVGPRPKSKSKAKPILR